MDYDADIEELKRTVTELRDRQAILDCIHRESRGRDRQDVDLIAACWWPEGIDEHGPIIMTAPDYPARANAGHARFFSATMHNLTTHTCEIEGNTAHSETYVIGTMLSPDKQSMKIAPGRYFDRLESAAMNGAFSIAAARWKCRWMDRPNGSTDQCARASCGRCGVRKTRAISALSRWGLTASVGSTSQRIMRLSLC